MQLENFEPTLNLFRYAIPFKPFTISMVNGDTIEVDFPGALAVRGGVAYYIGSGNVPKVFDHEGVSHIIGDLANQQAA